MRFLNFLLIICLISTAQILTSADEELVVTGSYLKDRIIESSPVAVSYTHLRAHETLR